MKELRTEITIQASPETIWHILTDLAKYPDWNPFITRARGKAEVGAKVDITVPSGAKELTLHCTVTKVDLNRELRWTYHVLLPNLFRGEHSFVIERVGPDQVRFVDREVFNGVLVPLQAKSIDSNSRHGFEAMDKALKVRAEQA